MMQTLVRPSLLRAPPLPASSGTVLGRDIDTAALQRHRRHASRRALEAYPLFGEVVTRHRLVNPLYTEQVRHWLLEASDLPIAWDVLWTQFQQHQLNRLQRLQSSWLTTFWIVNLERPSLDLPAGECTFTVSLLPTHFDIPDTSVRGRVYDALLESIHECPDIAVRFLEPMWLKSSGGRKVVTRRILREDSLVQQQWFRQDYERHIGRHWQRKRAEAQRRRRAQEEAAAVEAAERERLFRQGGLELVSRMLRRDPVLGLISKKKMEGRLHVFVNTIIHWL